MTGAKTDESLSKAGWPGGHSDREAAALPRWFKRFSFFSGSCIGGGFAVDFGRAHEAHWGIAGGFAVAAVVIGLISTAPPWDDLGW